MAAIKSGGDGTLSLAPSLLLSASPHAQPAAPCPIVSLVTRSSASALAPTRRQAHCWCWGPADGRGARCDVCCIHPPPSTCSLGELWALFLSGLSWDHCFISPSPTLLNLSHSLFLSYTGSGCISHVNLPRLYSFSSAIQGAFCSWPSMLSLNAPFTM